MIMQRRKLMLAAAAILLLVQYSATAQITDSSTLRNADSLISQNSSGPVIVYSVQQCIDSALRNNLSVKTAEFTARTAGVSYLQQLGNMLPTLSAYGQYANNGGKNVNTVTYTYVTENFNQGYMQATGNMVLWNGGSIQNFIRQYSLAYQADKKDWQYQKDLLTVTIILDYLNVLSTEEQLNLAQVQAADIRHKVDLMSIQDSLGSIAPSAFTDMKGQLNVSELTIVSTKNQLEANKLKLAQDMNMPYSPNLDLFKLNIDPTPIVYNASVDQVYQNATTHIAAVQAAQLHVASALKAVKATRGNMAPTLGLFYGVFSNYSTASTTTASNGTTYVQDGSYVTVNGAQSLVNYPQTILGATKGVPFNTQFKANVQTQVGLSLNIPILNHLNYRVLYKQSLVNRDQWIFNQKTVNAQLRQAVESSYVTMMQAYRTYNVTYKQVQNYEESFRTAQIRYNAGAINSLDFVIYNTNKNTAELQLISAKYSYILATKILDYYQGQLTW
jgi:outer membrane protein